MISSYLRPHYLLHWKQYATELERIAMALRNGPKAVVTALESYATQRDIWYI
jgi:hypothetical protein